MSDQQCHRCDKPAPPPFAFCEVCADEIWRSVPNPSMGSLYVCRDCGARHRLWSRQVGRLCDCGGNLRMAQ